MGVEGLYKLIENEIKNKELMNYFGKKIAIDANWALNKFIQSTNKDGQYLCNNKGYRTSHLSGLFYRSIDYLKKGIMPVYVFDDEPPTENNRDKSEIKEAHCVEARDLLKLMGIPFVNAKSEVEALALCCAMIKSNIIDCVATNNMNALQFGVKVLLRNFPTSKKEELLEEIIYENVLEGLELETPDQFIDLCSLLGCSYCDSIWGISPKEVHILIKQDKTIEKIMEKYNVTENWKLEMENTRNLYLLFKNQNVDLSEVKLEWKKPDENGLVDFLCTKHQFDEVRVKNGTEEIKKFLEKKSQKRIDALKNFPLSSNAPPNNKRKLDQKSKNAKRNVGKNIRRRK